jgi:predicted DNA-binding transcriptional regulator AlpA
MAAELGKREVAAPVKDWLTEDEVLGLLDVSAGTFIEMMAKGEFPRPVTFRGNKKARWRWVEVAWYFLGREIADRLEAEAPEGEPAPENKPTPKRG